MPRDIVNNLQQIMISGKASLLGTVPVYIIKIIERKEWEGRTKNIRGVVSPIKDFEDLVTTRLPYGLESSIDDLILFCERCPHPTEGKEAIRMMLEQVPLAGHGVRGEAKPKNEERGNNITSFERGTAKTYTLKKLARDCPELYEQVMDGELSANEAAIKAGFRKKTKTIPIDSPESAVKALLRVFSADEIVRAAKGETWLEREI